MYRTLTRDMSSELCSEAIDERVKVTLDTGDPDLVKDLRNLNKGRSFLCSSENNQ